jgi:succinoglycan biosynthesis protein ExoM
MTSSMTQSPVTTAVADGNAATPVHRISVCICTLKRPELLRRTLAKLEKQITEGLFTFSIVVADNDSMRSAQPAVAEFSSAAHVSAAYCMEPERNIAMARNKAVQNADGDLIAFIDDDEFPAEDWLLNLYKTLVESGADGILGPVKPYFEFEAPDWVKKGEFFDRPEYATGYKVSWEQSRTGNVLFRKDILNGLEIPFRPQFATAGEDMDFFRRAAEQGCRFVWCNEAIAFELVPAARCTRSYLLKRALLRGSNFPKHPTHRLRNIVKSLIAVPSYTLALPVLLLFGQHVFLKYLIKLLDHCSRLLAFMGLNLVTERQT